MTREGAATQTDATDNPTGGLFAQLRQMSTATISDALDRLGIAGQALGIRALDENFRVAGPAHTILYQPVDLAGGTVGDYIDDVDPGSVLVLDNAGRMDATVWGDILTLVASTRGVAGTVIDGICRDFDAARLAGYPIYARGHWMRTGKDRVKMVAQQVPVTLGGVLVNPGDVVIGDGDGIVVVPAGQLDRVLATATAIARAEEQIRAAFRAGKRLDEARRQLRYHALQTRDDGETAG